METMERTDAEPTAKPAPRGREGLASLIDMVTIGLPYALFARRAARGADGRALGRAAGGRWGRVFNWARPALDEQVGSPGAWIVGLRTVDSRTGRRVALWRTLALTLARAAIGELQRRAVGVRSPAVEAEHATLARELQAIKDAHPDDPGARADAIKRLYSERGGIDVRFNPLRVLGGVTAATFANRWLRRRLAPTVVIVTARRARERPHSP